MSFSSYKRSEKGQIWVFCPVFENFLKTMITFFCTLGDRSPNTEEGGGGQGEIGVGGAKLFGSLGGGGAGKKSVVQRGTHKKNPKIIRNIREKFVK